MPIPVPGGVKVEIEDRTIGVEGPKGRLEWELPARTSLSLEEGAIRVERQGDDKQARERHGLARALVSNMVAGVSRGFVRELEIQGVGFKAVLKGRSLDLSLGYSHTISYQVPEGIEVRVSEGTAIAVEGADKQAVGRVASEIRSFYPPEPYKGKGVRYKGEKLIRKEGKTVQ